MNPFVYVIVSILLVAVSQMLFKKGIEDFRRPPEGAGIWDWVRSLPLAIIAGLGLNGVSAFLWLLALSHLDISYIFPFLSMNYLLVTLGAWFLFKERVSWLRVIGIGVICLGLIVIAAEGW
jgi:drug/metabolite transporter (DMT)-like permease